MTTTATKRTTPAVKPAMAPAAKRTSAVKPAAAETPPAEAGDTAAQLAAVTIKFLGRTMRVELPTADQLGMWKLIGDALTRESTMDPAKRAALWARTIKLIGSVLADEEDRDWLQDEIVEKKVTIEKAAEIMVKAADAWQAVVKKSAPTTGPQTRARRAR